ncbi:MAG: phosphomannomutase [Gemmatimonadetes bacterium]|nr:phosphomannomutase [Gemmatimonadota bacterium]
MSNPLDLENVRTWCDNDPDPHTKNELAALIKAFPATENDLAERFGGRLAFGTAGLRGTLGAGPNRMNRAVVRQTTAGLADYLIDSTPAAGRRGVLIGYDGRHLSREMAHDTAGVLAARGIKAILIDRTAPTPLVAFGTTHFGTAAAVMVTASHNPPQDNGYKVYWSNGAQIIPPQDRGIAEAIDADLARLGEEGIGNAANVPMMTLDEARDASLLQEPGRELEAAYLDALANALPAAGRRDDPLTIVYTPLHGVGRELAERALLRAGFSRVHVVPEQADPDGDFPTVAFPNPEEPGAMDLALGLAEAVGADLVLANDPDADRLAVIARNAEGEFVPLDGNQIGVLLAEFLLDVAAEPDPKIVMNSIVSSGMLAVIAAAHGVEFETVLTGFKWIGNRALEREAKEPDLSFIFGYEEALGYTVGTVCRDKDGIGAAVAMAELAARARDEGLSVLDRLNRLYERHGLYLTRQRSIVLPGSEGAARIASAMAALRDDPPTEVGGFTVEVIADIEAGIRFEIASGTTTSLSLPRSNVLRFELEGSATVTARPSGTEPKIKFYFEVRNEVLDGDIAGARVRAATELEKLENSLIERLGIA